MSASDDNETQDGIPEEIPYYGGLTTRLDRFGFRRNMWLYNNKAPVYQQLKDKSFVEVHLNSTELYLPILDAIRDHFAYDALLSARDKPIEADPGSASSSSILPNDSPYSMSTMEQSLSPYSKGQMTTVDWEECSKKEYYEMDKRNILSMVLSIEDQADIDITDLPHLLPCHLIDSTKVRGRLVARPRLWPTNRHITSRDTYCHKCNKVGHNTSGCTAEDDDKWCGFCNQNGHDIGTCSLSTGGPKPNGDGPDGPGGGGPGGNGPSGPDPNGSNGGASAIGVR